VLNPVFLLTYVSDIIQVVVMEVIELQFLLIIIVLIEDNPSISTMCRTENKSNV